MKFGFKVIRYKHTPWVCYYMTINEVMVFNVYFSEKEVNEAIERVQAGGQP